ncbi:MAG: Brp/Blh family beta-carotene 15,15'-monooxygenase [Candidatus Azotimanducaceae bacterium]|jgi:Brp/Blh family beta-carotene 15,15'-monooxygenase
MTNWDILAIFAVLLFGVPHGGLDGAVARRIGWPTSVVSWLVFHLAYIALAALVAVLWWLFPLTSLSMFLLISALHFGASDIIDVGTDVLPWATHGGLVCIVIPSLQPTLVEPIFTILVGADNASLLMNVITNLFFPWLLCLAGYSFFAYRQPQYRKYLISLLVFIGLIFMLPPLISFSLYFCLWHSRGHMLRLWHSLERTERHRSVTEASIYTVISWISAGIIFYFYQETSSIALINITFIGLAALTLPHMLLVDYADRKSYLQGKLK